MLDTKKDILFEIGVFENFSAIVKKVSLKIAETALFLFDVDGGVTMFAE